MDDRAALGEDNRRSGPGLARLADRWSASAASALFLLALGGTRLPSCALLAWRGGTHLDRFLLGLLRFPVTFLLTLGHVDLLQGDDDAGSQCQMSLSAQTYGRQNQNQKNTGTVTGRTIPSTRPNTRCGSARDPRSPPQGAR